VINIPTVDMAKVVVGVGNAADQNSRKFVKDQLTAQPAERLRRRTVFGRHIGMRKKFQPKNL
jgi:hypothetical protein